MPSEKVALEIELPSPSKLTGELTDLIAKEANCEITYADHPDPLTYEEFSVIRWKINMLLVQMGNAYLSTHDRLGNAWIERVRP
jgi:hypothetical protein